MKPLCEVKNCPAEAGRPLSICKAHHTEWMESKRFYSDWLEFKAHPETSTLKCLAPGCLEMKSLKSTYCEQHIAASGMEEQPKRPDWRSYFMSIARQAATRATCDRKHVGAVIVKDLAILSTGYNGSVRGMPHCDDVGHMMENGSCVRTTHAEANAIIQAAKNGVAIDKATIYTTASPCFYCFKLIANAGLSTIVFAELYRDERITEFARLAGIELIHLETAAP